MVFGMVEVNPDQQTFESSPPSLSSVEGEMAQMRACFRYHVGVAGGLRHLGLPYTENTPLLGAAGYWADFNLSPDTAALLSARPRSCFLKAT